MRPAVVMELKTSASEESLLAAGQIEAVLINDANKSVVKPLLRLVDVPDEVRLLAQEASSSPSASLPSVIIRIDPAGGIEGGNGKILADILPVLYGTPSNVVVTLYGLRRVEATLVADLLSYRLE